MTSMTLRPFGNPTQHIFFIFQIHLHIFQHIFRSHVYQKRPKYLYLQGTRVLGAMLAILYRTWVPKT